MSTVTSDTALSWDWTDDTRLQLQEFLTAAGVVNGPITTRPIGDGHSNLTFLVSDGSTEVVVRRPPPPPIPPGAHDVLREARLLSALYPTEVPVPQVLATAEAGAVIDVPFYVMSFAPGPVITDATPPPLDTPAQRRAIGESLIDTLADLHSVDLARTGLDTLGRPEGFNLRHLKRMRRLIADDAGNPPAAFAAIDDWLEQHAPPESGATVIHCDFRIGNVVMAPDSPGRVAAVLDWELATVGDPLVDLGYLLATMPEPGAALNPTAELSAAFLEDGYPTKAQMISRYAERTGRPVGQMAWYITLALWKLAVLYEYSRRRTVEGVGDPYYTDPALVRSFLADARQVAGLPATTEP